MPCLPQVQYLSQMLAKVGIVVNPPQQNDWIANELPTAQSLGSLDLPQGRPSASDGPTRQGEAPGTNFPALPKVVRLSISLLPGSALW